MAYVFGGLFAAALALAVLLPAKYRSTGTILIEQQEVPTDVVRSAVSSYADQRVQVISQRVMTVANLLAIVEKYHLYADSRDTETREALAQHMRDDIHMRMISAEVMDPRQGRATKATIAFSIGYDSPSPATAARVANELTTLYLSENIESRKQLAANTADFLTTEAGRLGESVAALEAKVSAFKQKYGEKLPEFQEFNLNTVEGSRAELREIETRIRSLDQQTTYLDAQLAQTDAFGGLFSQAGERMLSTADRVKQLRTQLASALTRYTEKSPTVISMRAELEGLEEAMAAEGGKTPTADNPAFIQLTAQKNALANERRSLQDRLIEVRSRIEAVQSRQAAAPAVEQEYSALTRDLANERLKHNEVRQKQMEAQLVQNLETERKGERFTLIEPPEQPTEPVSPNRKLLVMLGLLLAVGGAGATLWLMETLDDTIRDRAHLLRLVGVPPLAMVPVITLAEELGAQRQRQKRFLATAVTAAVTLLVVIHFAVRPLNEVWLALARRFG